MCPDKNERCLSDWCLRHHTSVKPSVCGNCARRVGACKALLGVDVFSKSCHITSLKSPPTMCVVALYSSNMLIQDPLLQSWWYININGHHIPLHRVPCKPPLHLLGSLHLLVITKGGFFVWLIWLPSRALCKSCIAQRDIVLYLGIYILFLINGSLATIRDLLIFCRYITPLTPLVIVMDVIG